MLENILIWLYLKVQPKSYMEGNKDLYRTNYMPRVPKFICNHRLRILEETLAELLSVHYMKWDNVTMNKVQKAIAFWKKLRDGEEDYE